MKITKTLIMAAVAMLTAHGAFAVDSYLYWMASDSIVNYLAVERGDNSVQQWKYAMVSYDGNYLTMWNGSQDTGGPEQEIPGREGRGHEDTPVR